MYSLFLYEKQANKLDLSQNDIQRFLTQINFIKHEANTFGIGSDFATYLNFLGCSPSIFQDQHNPITIHTFNKMTYLGGESIDSLQCPQCKHKLKQPHLIFTQVHDYCCSTCGAKLNFSDINWRRSAAESTKFIQIHQIFPKEALPNNDLLLKLNHFTQSTWDYFYSKSVY